MENFYNNQEPISCEAASEMLQSLVGREFESCSKVKYGIQIKFTNSQILLSCSIKGVKNQSKIFFILSPEDEDYDLDQHEWGSLVKIGIDESDNSLKLLFGSGIFISAIPLNFSETNLLRWFAFLNAGNETSLIIGERDGIFRTNNCRTYLVREESFQ